LFCLIALRQLFLTFGLVNYCWSILIYVDITLSYYMDSPCATSGLRYFSTQQC